MIVERIVVGPIHLGALRAERARRSGHAMLAHLRTELFQAQREPRFPGARSAAERNVEALEEKIRSTKRELGLE